MVVIENMPPRPQFYVQAPKPAAVSAPVAAGSPAPDAPRAPEPAVPESADEKIARAIALSPKQAAEVAAPSQGVVSTVLPARIPMQCVSENAKDYHLSPFVLLSILKVESNGRTGRVGKNTNGTEDIGPSQFNTNTWAKVLTQKYKIPRDALLNNMCQSIRALAFAVRTEINAAGGDLWQGIGNYHSRTPVHHNKYIRLVYGAYKQMIKKGEF